MSCYLTVMYFAKVERFCPTDSLTPGSSCTLLMKACHIYIGVFRACSHVSGDPLIGRRRPSHRAEGLEVLLPSGLQCWRLRHLYPTRAPVSETCTML
jgi:hypothetical protein